MSATGMRLSKQDAHVLLARGGPHIPKLTLKTESNHTGNRLAMFYIETRCGFAYYAFALCRAAIFVAIYRSTSRFRLIFNFFVFSYNIITKF